MGSFARVDEPDQAAEAVAAARQLSLILLISGGFTVTAVSSSSMPNAAILAVAGAHLVAGALIWLAPWPQWGLALTAGPGLVALVLLSVTTWAFDGFASGIGPMFVLVFAWFGLHHRQSTIAAAVPLAAIGYATALVVADARMRLVVSTLVLIPIAALVGFLIARTVGQLRQTQRTLEVKDRWRTALMATLAHDVRSPLSTVIGVLEVVQDDPAVNSRHQPLLDSAVRQSQRVLRLAMGILEVERIEQGKMRLNRQEVNLADVAQEVALLTQAELVQVDVPAPMTVLADGERLEQILYNLVNNALRHGRPPVVISAVRLETHTEIAVSDQGDGVPETESVNLFDRFSSADHSPQSVGLGLWIVRLLADAHDGSVRYDPTAAGARFVVSVPLGSPTGDPKVSAVGVVQDG
ncbi:hypothetical protein BH09ACT12_BH09ACT12_05400 [soil metagenome]